MNILQVANKVPYPTIDGGAIACMNLTRGFSLLGHKVTVLAMNTLKHKTSVEEIPESVRDLADFKFVKVDARISKREAIQNLLFSSEPYNAVRFVDKSFENELIGILKGKKFDVIQLEGLYVCPYIPVIRKYSNAKIVYRAHNIEHEIWERTSELAKGWKKLYLRNLSKRIKRFEKNVQNKYDLLVPITERDGIILDELGNKKPKYVSQTGIDSSVLIPNAKSLEYPSLFHIGSLEWAPNQEGIIWFIENCWEEIHDRFPDLKFYVAGRNAPQWLVQKIVGPNIVFLGEVEDAYDFMNSKAIMIVPLFSGSGMRIKIIEGMALGKSIVTTPIGTEGISTTSGTNILIAEKREEFIESVSQLVEDKEFFHIVGKNAIEYIHKKFDNLAASASLVDFYKQHTQ
ncbi:glycosyltransferase family 4 protein [Maribellus maritimus]|uniref:glycosyltransferase family 4 protein n=1 Tax=Maribellus maritimus TaxID=2870838 RepID=UPI001EEC11EE|nr:glycosyltransferase family 4 protein [Maribellus maritimus]MCG6186441.1 glycosyltransferase family 4 protein [Maribellus maritimus]